MLEDQLAIACVMAVELKAKLVCEQRLQKRLALDELKIRDVPTVEMQEIEGVIESRTALAIGGRLGIGEAWQASLIDTAQFAIEITGLDVQVRERRGCAWIFGGPVEAGPGQELHAAIVDAGGHAKAVELDFMQPLRPRGGLFDELGELRRDERAEEGRLDATDRI